MPTFLYPGSFCPPTLGHFRIVERAAQLFSPLTIVCSTNETKSDRWFTEEECRALWRAYVLPPHVRVETFASIKALRPERPWVMIRGLRNADEFAFEQQVMASNATAFGLSSFVYLLADPSDADISSSRVREMALKLELERLFRDVAPLVISKLIEHVLQIDQLVLVVGKPGGGKSTFLNELVGLDSRNVVISLDKDSASWKPLLRHHFHTDDLVALALTRDEEVTHFLAKTVLEQLKVRLRTVAPKSRVFVEAAYGLQATKRLFRFLGGKILYVGCRDEEEQGRRVVVRGTPELLPFLNRIPGESESRAIAAKERCAMLSILTDGPMDHLREQAKQFQRQLCLTPEFGGLQWSL